MKSSQHQKTGTDSDSINFNEASLNSSTEALKKQKNSKLCEGILSTCRRAVAQFDVTAATREHLDFTLPKVHQGNSNYSVAYHANHVSLFETLSDHHIRSSSLTNDIYDSSFTRELVGIGVAFGNIFILFDTSVCVESSSTEGFNTTDSSDFSSDRFGFFTPEILEQNPAALGFNAIASVSVFVADTAKKNGESHWTPEFTLKIKSVGSSVLTGKLEEAYTLILSLWRPVVDHLLEEKAALAERKRAQETLKNEEQRALRERKEIEDLNRIQQVFKNTL